MFVNSVRGAVDVRSQIDPRLPDERFQCIIIDEISRVVDSVYMSRGTRVGDITSHHMT